MKKTILSVLVFLSVIILLIRFGANPVLDFLGYKTRGGIKIISLPEGAVVFINGMEVGKTPYQNENLEVKEHELKLVLGNSIWQGAAKLNNGTLTLINRELALNIASSSGEMLTLEPGKGVLVTSNPSGANVEIEGKDYGKTPILAGDLPSGEYTFILSHDNYLKRSVRAAIPKDMRLHLDVDLALSEADLNSISSPVVKTVQKLIVKQTPTGFLRLRDKPSTKGVEVGRVSPGDSLTLIEELSGWYKVRTEDNIEGYVSSQYIQKQS